MLCEAGAAVSNKSDWWNQDRIDRLVELREAGMTYGQIADEMGTTKNAIVGKASRIRPVTEPPPPQPTERQCRWPLWGDEAPTHAYCLVPTDLLGSSYCGAHTRIAHAKIRDKD